GGIPSHRGSAGAQGHHRGCEQDLVGCTSLVTLSHARDACHRCVRLEDAVCVAAMYVSILRMLYRIRRNNQTWRTYPLFLLSENRWRAQRYGVAGTLFDFGKGELVPFRDLVDELIVLLREDAEALGCLPEVEHARTIVA